MPEAEVPGEGKTKEMQKEGEGELGTEKKGEGGAEWVRERKRKN